MKHSQTLNEIKQDEAVICQFLELYRSVLQGTAPTPDLPWDWDGIFALAHSQQVFPLIFEAAAQIPEFSGHPMYLSYMKSAMAEVAAQSIRTEALLQLYREFRRAGIAPLVVKGIVCRLLYGELADHRPSGDEDLLVRPQDYCAASRVLHALGYEGEDIEDAERSLDRITEITFINHSIPMTIELHFNLLGTFTPLHTCMSRFFDRCYEREAEITVEGTPIATMGCTDHFVFLVFHALKHFLLSGLGVRQLADILLYEKACGDRIDWQKAEAAIEEVRAIGFYADLHEIGNTRLGFSLPLRWETACPDLLLKDMMMAGAFGLDSRSSSLAGQITQTGTDEKTGSQLGRILRTAFPTREYMIARNPALRQHPGRIWLDWLGRWRKCLRRLRGSDRHVLAETVKISQKRAQLLKKYGLY